jgi:hypothetical protein
MIQVAKRNVVVRADWSLGSTENVVRLAIRVRSMMCVAGDGMDRRAGEEAMADDD